MKPKLFRSLSFNLISWYMLLLLLMVLLISWSVIKIVETEVLKSQMVNLQAFTEATVNYLENSTEKSKEIDIETLSRWIVDPLKKSGILLGIVVFYRWEPVFIYGKIPNYKKEVEYFLASEKEKLSKKIYFSRRTFTLSRYYWADFFWNGRGNLKLLIRYNLKWLNMVTGRILKIIFFYILSTTILIIALLLWVTGKKVILPIQKLTEASDKVGRGEFLTRKPYPSGDEFGLLSESMYEMSEKLKEDRETILDQIKELNEAYSKLKEMQEEIIRSEKLALIGQMTSGLAHEVGNPITSIIGLAQIMLKTGTLSEEDRDFVKRILSEGERINNLIKTLLNFSRPSKGHLKKTELKEIINRATEILNVQGKLKNIELEIKAENVTLCTDGERLLQVILNLLINAADAIREKFGASPGGKIKLSAKKENEKVLISISDNGIGIENENIKKIFLPFYTTKEPGKGTGLGLYVSSIIIDQLQGKISAESSSQVGTTFHINLPHRNSSC